MLLLLPCTASQAQETDSDSNKDRDTSRKLNPASSSELFFDARETKLNKDQKHYVFNGDVVGMIGGLIIAADILELDRERKVFEARGNVFILMSDMVFSGTKIIYSLEGGDFDIFDARLVANDPGSAREISHRVLGIRPEELASEAQREKRLQEIAKEKELIRRQFSESRQAVVDPETIERYAVLLERERLVREQENPALAHLGEERREALLNRRKYFAESQKKSIPLNQQVSSKGFFRILGDKITRKNENDFGVNKAFITPCFCSEDEAPAWGFHARHVDFNVEGYADLYDPIIEVKGIPILYLPYLKIPVKNQRQSGLLLPNISFSRLNGTVFSQPTYFALDESRDMTTYLDFIEKRGVRVGTEYRQQQRKYSGWEISGEALRDKVWLKQQSKRKQYLRTYSDGLSKARAEYKTGSWTADHADVGNPAWWQSAVNNGEEIGLAACLEDNEEDCERSELQRRLTAPENKWRGKLNWQGQSYLSPRLSVVGSGSVVSDHRYTQDLYIQTFDESVFKSANPRLLSKAKLQLHLDKPDYYLGLGSKMADQMKTEEYFGGYQIPVHAKYMSRSFQLTQFPLPVYASARSEFRQISLFREPEFPERIPDQTVLYRLGDGNWKRGMIRITSPIISDEVFRIDHFTEFEGRQITADKIITRDRTEDRLGTKLKNEHIVSSIRTYRTGFNLNLPIDGRAEYRVNPKDPDSPVQVVEHRMNWGATISLRPVVVREGNYGEAPNKAIVKHDALTTPSGARELTYFEADTPSQITSEYVPDELKMVEHKTVTFFTTHDWFSSEANWKRTEGDASGPASSGPGSELEVRRRAERELFYSLELPVNDFRKMFDDQHWFTSRYRREVSGRTNPAHLESNIGYDFLKETARNKAREKDEPDKELPEPWTPLNTLGALRLLNWTFGAKTQYNVYKRGMTNLELNLIPPTVFATTLSLGYSIDKNYFPLRGGGFAAKKSVTRRYGLQSALVPDTTLTFGYATKTLYEQLPGRQEEAKVAMAYAAPSKCWGLNFQWIKEFADVTWDGTYYLALVVQFFNYNREYGNFTSRFNQEDSAK